jgi:dTMP kinase
MKGQFIVVEGLDGAGKSGIVKRISQWLSDVNVDHLTTYEPGGTDLANMLRKGLREGFDGIDEEMDPTTEMLLFQAARAHHVNFKLRPALEQGKVVICDRYYQTTIAYQGAGRGLDIDLLMNLQKRVIKLEPTKVILLDGRVDVFLGRLTRREEEGVEKMNRLDSLGLSFYQRAREQYQAMANQNADQYLVVNAEQNPEQVFAQIIPLLMEIKNKYSKRPMA